MLKARCGNKNGKYCEEFIGQTFKMVDYNPFLPFHECATNIFEFLSFYLHYEDHIGRLPLLSTPPSPFLSLQYAKTIIIEPWCVLAYHKNGRLMLRAHTNKLLA